MTTFKGVTHAPGGDGLLGEGALCGADPATNYRGVLRMQDAGYTCLVCIDIANQAKPLPPEPCEGQAFANVDEAISAGFTAGFDRFRHFACTEGHVHVTDGRFGGAA